MLFMDDLKIFAQSDHEVNGLVSTVHIFSKDIGIEFGIKKCGVLVMRREKVVLSEGVKMPDGEKIGEVRKMYISILVFQNTTKSNKRERKENFWKEYLRRTRIEIQEEQEQEQQYNDRNTIMAMNTWTVSFVR